MATPCYLAVETDEQRLSLRRFGFGPSDSLPDRHACPARAPISYSPGHETILGCDASGADYATIPLIRSEEGYQQAPAAVDRDDPHWPTVCGYCGEPFSHDEVWQENGAAIMRVTVTVPGAAATVGDLITLRDLPPGAIWEATWLRDWQVGFDGRGFICRLPDGHDWQIDGEASNCTRKGDRSHRCWIRHGEPPYLTIDKGGETCAAGAGSIASPGYHGFLRDGILT